MGEKTSEEIIELYEMLGVDSQQKSARRRRGVVNEVQVKNGAAQLTEVTQQVALLNSRAQPNNEVCGICCVFGHGANMCPHNMYEPEQLNFMNVSQPMPRFDPYTNTYNLGWRSHPNFSWRNNQAPIQNTMPSPLSNNDQLRKSTLEETLNTFIQFNMDNHERHNKRLDSLEASMKRVEV